MRQRDNAIGAVVSAFSGGAVRERDSRGGGKRLALERQKGMAFLQFSENGRKRESGWGLKFLEDKIVFFIKFIQ